VARRERGHGILSGSACGHGRSNSGTTVMAITVTNIIPRKLAETSATIQYTATGATTIIDKFTVTNVGAANTLITVYLPNANSSGNPLASNTVINARSIGIRETYSCPELVGQVIPDGATIVTTAGTASSLVISATGSEIS